MDIENIKLIGMALVSLTSILGTYYLALKIKDFNKENPDPKITYVTHTQMATVRAEIMRIISEAVQDLRCLRSEIREEVRSMQKQHNRTLSETRELVSKNAQNISSLIAQAQLANQRISELSLKTDRIALKIKGDFQ